jgi:hypothetical protein
MSQQPSISSSFTGTGQSAEFVGQSARVRLTFGGGSVEIQVQDDDMTWVYFSGPFTASQEIKFDGARQNFRLNCTAHSSDIKYRIWTHISDRRP